MNFQNKYEYHTSVHFWNRHVLSEVNCVHLYRSTWIVSLEISWVIIIICIKILSNWKKVKYKLKRRTPWNPHPPFFEQSIVYTSTTISTSTWIRTWQRLEIASWAFDGGGLHMNVASLARRYWVNCTRRVSRFLFVYFPISTAFALCVFTDVYSSRQVRIHVDVDIVVDV